MGFVPPPLPAYYRSRRVKIEREYKPIHPGAYSNTTKEWVRLAFPYLWKMALTLFALYSVCTR